MPTSDTSTDLLGMILNGQDLLLANSDDVLITRDGKVPHYSVVNLIAYHGLECSFYTSGML